MARKKNAEIENDVMADEGNEGSGEAPVTQGQLAQSMGMMATAVEKLVENTPRRIPISKFKTKSPFNPTGNKRRKLSRVVFQNGFRCDIKKLFDEEILLLNRIAPGRYLDGAVTVREVHVGTTTQLHLAYANKTVNQRMANMKKWRNFLDLLRQIDVEGGTATA